MGAADEEVGRVMHEERREGVKACPSMQMEAEVLRSCKFS